MIASRVRSEIDSSPRARSRNMGTEFRRNNDNLKTVALLPVSRNVPIESFARKLHIALEGIGAPTSCLNQVSVSNVLGRHAFTRMGKLKTAAWLANQEQRYKMVLYVADSSVGSSWTQTCIRQADYVLVIGLGDDPSIGEYERLLLSMKTTARKELVLLHPERSVLPGSTREWLKVGGTPFASAAAHNYMSTDSTMGPSTYSRGTASLSAFRISDAHDSQKISGAEAFRVKTACCSLAQSRCSHSLETS